MKDRRPIPDELVAALIDGTLSPEERERVLRALGDSPEETEALVLLRDMVDALPELQETPVPDRVVERALELVRRPSLKSLFLRAVVRLEGAALSVVEHTATLVSTLSPTPEPVRSGKPTAEGILLATVEEGRRLAVEVSPEGARARIRVTVRGREDAAVPDGSEVTIEGPDGKATAYLEGGEADLGACGLGRHVIVVEELGWVELDIR
jgi:anti-sigma factor RsiW